MDTPQVTPALLARCARELDRPATDAVLGHAPDGGWWGIGLQRPDPSVFLGVEMSTRCTGADQQRRLDDLGLRSRRLPVLLDVDHFADARRVAASIPGTAFASCMTRVDRAVCAARVERGGVERMNPTARLQVLDGHATDARTWTEAADRIDARILARVVAPVLDVGCGPGRHVAELAASGLVALGIDVSPAALGLARARGACVLERSVFDRVPCAGRWRTALLLDGNIGIGGDPASLLLRIGELLAHRGSRVLVETAPPETRAVDAHRTAGDRRARGAVVRPRRRRRRRAAGPGPPYRIRRHGVVER